MNPAASAASQGPPIQVGMTTYGYLYRATLEASLDSIARAGFHLVEISAVAPHVPATAFDWDERRQVKRLLEDRGLTSVAINAPELNLISPNREVRDVALGQYRRCIGLAHDLGARLVVVIPGRRGPLIPMPAPDATELALLQLSRMLGTPVSMELGWRWKPSLPASPSPRRSCSDWCGPSMTNCWESRSMSRTFQSGGRAGSGPDDHERAYAGARE